MTALIERRAHYAPRPVVALDTPADIREAKARARQLVLAADIDQLDDIREYDETRESCRDRMLRLLAICPFTVLTMIGG
jgi:hypothetical protein